MPHSNSHCPSIDESPKPFSSKVTVMQYDLATLTRSEFMRKYRVTAREYNEMLCRK